MAGREKRTWQQVYMDYHGTDVPAENRGKRYQAWAEQKKQEQAQKEDAKRKKWDDERNRRKNYGSGGGHGF